MKQIKIIAMTTAALAMTAACTPEPEAEEVSEIAESAEESQPTTILGVAESNPDFSTLTTAVGASGIGEALAGEGPFTVFAPTNAAFEKVDDETLNGLLSAEDKTPLADLLKYHVVEGELKAADVLSAIEAGGGTAELTTLAGGTLSATLDGENVVITDGAGGTSTVVTTDVDADNGVIHAIDTVLMPG